MARVPVDHIPAIPGLLTAFAPPLSGTEALRKQLRALFAPADAVKAAQMTYGWAVRGELAALFAGSPQPAEPLPNPGILDDFIASETRLPPTTVTLREAPSYGVNRDTLPLLDEALRSDLPQRRLEGWCALLCLCALNRTDL